ncbi:BFH_HP2_G0027910.mRNA.1.CDS.1 [Saccharomyces cerevisiae]|nr:BFH_HP2_G0027910.mRNA.1.CDS.1 [Saccharomyces cerevisiae]CAI6574768.1 BFH_HP2_G0027910.mRNA.1.CDS.1 [Saccharomyces cerevisiae]CAI6582761.1 BFH_HP1_G0027930.mRNA.1.CDS.1 [Saccharomyces cerevisiae]
MTTRNMTTLASSIEHKTKHLAAPFENDENPWMKKYCCQCKSCKMSVPIQPWLPRFFVFGILCPVFWLVNLLAWWFLQYWQPHELEFHDLQEDEYPGFYEYEAITKRTVIPLKEEVLQEIRVMQNFSDSNSEEYYESKDGMPSSFLNVNTEQVEDENDTLKKYRYAFLKKVAHDVLESHDLLRKTFRNWNLRSLLGLLIVSILIIFVVLLCKKSR